MVGFYACHYLIDTGHIRGGDPSECDKRETGRKRRRKEGASG